MAQTQPSARLYTVEEYQAFEATSPERHEFYRGDIMAMLGGTANHNELVLNCAAELRQTVRRRGCRVFTETVQLEVAEGIHYTYPDVMVTCHDKDVTAERIMRYPVLIIEVISPLTADRDWLWKLFRYQRLASLRHYLLISQQYQAVEWYYQTNESSEWQRELLTKPEEAIEIPELGARLLLADIYASLRIPLVTDDKAGG
ncbi:Uma2 family endonuclease [Hymenobacter sp. GOD-10R]|uniref:Uma2 family endonuclease n=1 Tax=Hymenobacter sp. GOD-10R TaxID=3093922 RepID=UPI002D775894|nr:Uma2 family endonuclease [Hymenobacter sp. GOD-10R]WRQ27996.1 Uma2 family endonuclease [Hymenobacter sp. GOD-10R]